MTVSFGIIGSGYMAKTYASALAQGLVPDGRLGAIAVGKRATGLAAEFGVPVEASVESLVGRSDIDAVIITTPHSAHLPEAKIAAAAGKHVFTEKPMALSVAECDAMISACRAADVQLAVNKVLRFRVAPMATKRLIDDGAIGDVRMILARAAWTAFFLVDIYDAAGNLVVPDKPWARDPAEGSQFLDWGVHNADIMRWYTGSDAVLAFGRYHSYGANVPVPDLSAMVSYEFANGVLAQVLMTYEVPQPGFVPEDSVTIIGTTGIIEADHFGKVRLGKGDRWDVVAEMPQFDYLAGYLDPKRLKGFADQVQDFTEAIRDHRPPAVTGEDGRKAVEMVEAADRSAATGASVAIPFA
jgi:predicted dehydrogenase